MYLFYFISIIDNHTCSKCGKRGHAANECRSSRGNYSDNKFRSII